MGNEDLINFLNEKYSSGAISLEQYNKMLEEIKISNSVSRKEYLLELKNQGNEFAKEGKFFEALERYDKALEIDPEYKELWNNKAIVLERLGRREEALNWHNKYQNRINQKKREKTLKISFIIITILAVIIGAVIFIPPIFHVPLYNVGDLVNNTSMDPNNAYIILDLKNNQYSVVLATQKDDYWEWDKNGNFLAGCYDFDLKNPNKVGSFYQNKYVSGDLVRNNSMKVNEGILVIDSQFGFYFVVPVTKSGIWLYSKENIKEAGGRNFDVNHPILVEHLYLSDIAEGELPVPKYRSGDVLIDKDEVYPTVAWKIIIDYHLETDEYETNIIFKNSDGSWGHFVNSDTNTWDRSFIERQYPVKLTNVDLDTIDIGYLGSSQSTSVETVYHIGDVALPSMNSNQGFIIEKIDYANQKYGVRRVYSKYNWKPLSDQQMEWYGFTEFVIQNPSRNIQY